MATFNIKYLSKEQKQLRVRILEISHKNKFSHLGSCLSAVDLINMVYKMKKENDLFILSNGHAGVALYVVLEKYGLIKKSTFAEKLHVHPDRNTSIDIHVSSGSLGQGLPIALGMAMADQKRRVFCMISDGECSEGSIWETINVAVSKKINNLNILINANGWGAYDPIYLPRLIKKLKGFGTYVIPINGHSEEKIALALKKRSQNVKVIFGLTRSNQLPFLVEQDAHYYTMTEDDYRIAGELLK